MLEVSTKVFIRPANDVRTNSVITLEHTHLLPRIRLARRPDQTRDSATAVPLPTITLDRTADGPEVALRLHCANRSCTNSGVRGGSCAHVEVQTPAL